LSAKSPDDFVAPQKFPEAAFCVDMLIEPPPPPPPVCSEWRSQLAAYKTVVDFNGFVQIKKKT
jgi:hypothetical protein